MRTWLVNKLLAVIFYLEKGEDMEILAVYIVHRIMKGKLHFWEIPKDHIARNRVIEILKDDGVEHLIIEEKPAD